MRKFRGLRLLVACLVVLSTSAPSLASTLSWFCDGRLCGALLCCCEQPDLSKTDGHCTEKVAKNDKAGLCASDCGCTPIVTAAHDLTGNLKPTIASLNLPTLCLAPLFAPVASAGYFSLVPTCLPDYRGPPRVPSRLACWGLRGPPTS